MLRRIIGRHRDSSPLTARQSLDRLATRPDGPRELMPPAYPDGFPGNPLANRPHRCAFVADVRDPAKTFRRYQHIAYLELVEGHRLRLEPLS